MLLRLLQTSQPLPIRYMRSGVSLPSCAPALLRTALLTNCVGPERDWLSVTEINARIERWSIIVSQGS